MPIRLWDYVQAAGEDFGLQMQPGAVDEAAMMDWFEDT
jgi:hypothetical protein